MLEEKQLRDIINGLHKINPNEPPFVTILGGKTVYLHEEVALELIAKLCKAINEQLVENQERKFIHELPSETYEGVEF